jgi:hypothetical protein
VATSVARNIESGDYANYSPTQGLKTPKLKK